MVISANEIVCDWIEKIDNSNSVMITICMSLYMYFKYELPYRTKTKYYSHSCCQHCVKSILTSEIFRICCSFLFYSNFIKIVSAKSYMVLTFLYLYLVKIYNHQSSIVYYIYIKLYFISKKHSSSFLYNNYFSYT